MSSEQKETSNRNQEFITLVSGEQCFCIDIKSIREIRRWSPATRLPHSPPHILGVMNLRGAVIPIIDLSSVLGFGKTNPTTRHVTIIVSLDDRISGLLVESVSEILSVKSDLIQEPPKIREDETNYCIKGIIAQDDDITRIIDLGTLLPVCQRVAA